MRRGFHGSTCAINVDECQGNPCGSHGVCADRVGFYECTMQDTAGKIVISRINVLPGNTAPMKARSSAAQAMESSVGRQESAPAYAAMASRGTTVRYHRHVLQETRAFQAQLHVPTDHGKVKGVTGFCECSCDSGYGDADYDRNRRVAGVHRPSEAPLIAAQSTALLEESPAGARALAIKITKEKTAKRRLSSPEPRASAKSWLCEVPKLVSTRKPSSCSARQRRVPARCGQCRCCVKNACAVR